jgi:hypothetical protein
LSTALLFSACKKDDDEEEVAAVFTVSETYSGDFEANPPATASVVESFGGLESQMKKGDPTKGSNAVTSATLSGLYAAGTMSLKDIASPSYDAWATGTLFPEFETASGTVGQVFDFADPSQTAKGGAAFEHLLSGDPVELEQLVGKGSFGGAFFSYVKNTLFAMPTQVTSDQLDQALVLYGSDPTFESAGLSAKYAAKRFVSVGGETYHAKISYEFRKAQSAINQGFTSERESAVNEITRLWEEALAAQAMYYLNGVAEDLAFEPDYTLENGVDEDGNPVFVDYNTVADAIHGWSEGVAFLEGFHGVENKMITDAQIVSVLAKVNARIEGPYTPLDLINNPTEIAELQAGIADLANAYSIDQAAALTK